MAHRQLRLDEAVYLSPNRATVGHLIRTLNRLPFDAVVYLAADAEGNSFHRLNGIIPETVSGIERNQFNPAGSVDAVVLYPFDADAL